ncbi:MAG: hypothetical protein IT466_10420 [Moraxellaceae bacterium]|nr:hypothetical protein [Moraxellaceae bacterium]
MDSIFVVELVDFIHEIDRQLARANRLLMFSQPKRQGRVTIHFRKIPKGSKGVAAIIPPCPEPVQWFVNKASGEWFWNVLPITNLKKRAKGKLEWAVGHHHTALALARVGELIKQRQRAVEILRVAQFKFAHLEKGLRPLLRQSDPDLIRWYHEFHDRRMKRSPTPAEQSWFLEGTPFPYGQTADEINEELEAEGSEGGSMLYSENVEEGLDELDSLMSEPEWDADEL